jgi:RHS repeat-associated protein
VQYGYANGSANTIRPTGLTSPDGSAVSWDYVSSLAGALSRPDAVKESSGSVTLATFKFLGKGRPVSLKYDAASNAEWTMRNGASSGDAGDVYTGLDRFGRLVETIWQAGSTELVHTTYGRHRVGGVTWQRNVLAHAMTGSPLPPERLQQDNFYWYDGLQQNYQHQRGDLAGTAPNYTGITNLQQTEIRSFDETGNWLSNYTSSPALTQSRTHNKANEIATISGITAPTFDGTGNMKTMPKPGAWSTTCTLTWDAWNRLITCTDGTTTTTNRYDALARRIRKSITGGEVRDYYYDKQWRSIEERLSGTFSGPDKTRHVWSPFDRWTLIRRQRETAGTLTDTHFCLKDYLDPAALISPAAVVVERFSYDSFGPVRFMNAAFVTQSSSSYAWTFLFHAEFIDTESGLYNYGYRFYHPQLGRWINRDPIAELGGLNLFAAFFNNPAFWLDRLGFEPESAIRDLPDIVNCVGFACRQKNAVQPKPNKSWSDVMKELGYTCTANISAKDCPKHCNCSDYIMLYIYVPDHGLQPGKTTSDVKKEAEEDYRSMGGKGDYFNDPYDLLPPTTRMDYHGLRGNSDGSYNFQPSEAKKGSDEDKTKDPPSWKPTDSIPDFFDNKDLYGKWCCCKARS